MTRDNARSFLLNESEGFMEGRGASQFSTPIPQESWRHAFPEIIGRSQPMLKVLETVSKVARSDSAVLILGESGTGKELIAAALHRLSQRTDRRFITINCSAIPENLLESELFGHEKGSFTGADRRRQGHFELADGGSIFLDEIGDMPPSLQAKLLRVLQEKQYTPVGGSELKYADVRVIAATNIDLEKAIRSGTFRHDLYYRLNVLPIHLPPLRDRMDDIPALLEFFLDNANRLYRADRPCFFTQESIDCLVRYSWPGNVRELQNLAKRIVVLCDGEFIKPEHLPKEMREAVRDRPHSLSNTSVSSNASGLDREQTSLGSRAGQPGFSSQEGQEGELSVEKTTSIYYPKSFGDVTGEHPSALLPNQGLDMPQFIEQIENSLILQALQRTNNNKNQAAKLLGLNRTTLVERIKKRRIAPLNEPSSEL